MNRDLINYIFLTLVGIILFLSFIFFYRDFDYYVEKISSEDTEEARIGYLNKAIDAWKESDGVTKKAYAYIYIGDYYFKSEKYQESITEFGKAIKTDPKRIEGYLARGTSYMRVHNIKKAVSDFNKALELEPENPHALFNKGLAYHKSKEFGKALNYYNQALKSSIPNVNGKIFRSIGILLLETDKPEAALESLHKSYRLIKDPYTVFLSIIAGSELSPDKYIKEKKKLTHIRPENDWLRTLIKFYQGNITEGTLFAEAKNAQNPKQVRERLCEAYYYSGKMAQFKGDKKKAKKYMELTLKQNIPEFIETGLAEAELDRNP